METQDDWPAPNCRRFELINKQYATALTDAEAAELERLQQVVDLKLMPHDLQMLAWVQRLRQEAESCSKPENPTGETS